MYATGPIKKSTHVYSDGINNTYMYIPIRYTMLHPTTSTYIHIYLCISTISVGANSEKSIKETVCITNIYDIMSVLPLSILLLLLLLLILLFEPAAAAKENSIYIFYILYKYARSDGRCRCETKGVRFHLMMCVMDRFIFFYCRSLNELAVLSVDCGFVWFPP